MSKRVLDLENVTFCDIVNGKKEGINVLNLYLLMGIIFIRMILWKAIKRKF